MLELILRKEMDIGNVCVLIKTSYTHKGLFYTYRETNFAASTVSGLRKSEFLLSIELKNENNFCFVGQKSKTE